jgi:phosphoglycolate phosphatase-like HAD superfamily hydrolase
MKLFIWDFHGVLEKGNDLAVLELTNKALLLHGYERQMNEEEAELLSGRRWYEYFLYLLPGLELKEYMALQGTCFELSKNHPEVVAKYIRLNDHAEDVLESIHSSNYSQILISNTHPLALEMFVQVVGIEKYFPPHHRFGVDSHTQQQFTKKECLEEYLKDKHFPEGIVSIGDSPGDIAMIHHYPHGIGYLYSHPGRVHREIASHYKINDLRLVLNEIKKIKLQETHSN